MKDLQKNTVPAKDQNASSFFPHINPLDHGEALRVLYVGNSISKHSPKPSIGWHRDCGMAASDEAHDYVHLLQARIEEKHINASYAILQAANFERSFDHIDLFSEKDYDAASTFTPDVIVMFFGANVPREYDEGKPFACTFGEAYHRLRHFLDPHGNARVVHVQGFYIRDAIDEEKRAVAEQHGDPFVTLDEIRTSEETHGEFNHPNDYGMRCIADRIWETLKEWI